MELRNFAFQRVKAKFWCGLENKLFLVMRLNFRGKPEKESLPAKSDALHQGSGISRSALRIWIMVSLSPFSQWITVIRHCQEMEQNTGGRIFALTGSNLVRPLVNIGLCLSQIMTNKCTCVNLTEVETRSSFTSST